MQAFVSIVLEKQPFGVMVILVGAMSHCPAVLRMSAVANSKIAVKYVKLFITAKTCTCVTLDD